MPRHNITGMGIVAFGIGIGLAFPPHAAFATSMSLQDVPAFSVADPVAPPADAADLSDLITAPEGRELWGPRNDLRVPGAGSDTMTFGGAALAELIAAHGSISRSQFASDLEFDAANFADWYRFSTDFSFELEFDEMLDYQAIAVATYRPDVQYWLEGNHWAQFGSSVPIFQLAAKENKAKQGTPGPNQKSFAPLSKGAANNSFGEPKANKHDEEATRVFSLDEFLLNMFFKLFSLPITYVILTVCLGAVVISYYRQPRT